MERLYESALQTGQEAETTTNWVSAKAAYNRALALKIDDAKASSALANVGIIVPDEFPTVSQAIGSAKQGTIVRVRAGVYDEVLNFQDGIRLLGESMDTVKIRCDAKQGSVLTVRGCRSGIISDLTMEHTGSDNGENPAALLTCSESSVEVLRCRVQNSAGSGIRVKGKSNPSIHECVARLNQRSGIVFEEGATGVAEANTCEINKSAGIGVLGKGTSPKLVRNQCHSNGAYGIGFVQGASGSAEENACDNNKMSGISVLDSDTTVTLNKNQCRGNERNGIMFNTGASGTAEGNVCEGSADAGINVFGRRTELA